MSEKQPTVNQHYIPQFLQKNFAIDKSKKTVPILKPVTISENNGTYKEPPTKGKNTVQILKRVPISKNKDEYKELIQNASIKTNMQYENLYSDTQEAEKNSEISKI